MHPISLTAVILAGGRGSRLGGRDKPLVELAGRPLVEHILDRLRPQVDRIMINANRHPDRYARYGVPVFADEMRGFQGPLAGMLAALYRSETHFVLFVPGDAPLVDRRYAARMYAALRTSTADACVAVADGRLQSVHCLLARELSVSIADTLPRQASVTQWLRKIGAATVDCSDMPRQFMNLNAAADLPLLTVALEQSIAEHSDDR